MPGMPRLSIFDVLHRGVVNSLLGISGWAVWVGVYGHQERKAALMQRAQASKSAERKAIAEQQEQVLNTRALHKEQFPPKNPFNDNSGFSLGAMVTQQPELRLRNMLLRNHCSDNTVTCGIHPSPPPHSTHRRDTTTTIQYTARKDCNLNKTMAVQHSENQRAAWWLSVNEIDAAGTSALAIEIRARELEPNSWQHFDTDQAIHDSEKIPFQQTTGLCSLRDAVLAGSGVSSGSEKYYRRCIEIVRRTSMSPQNRMCSGSSQIVREVKYVYSNVNDRQTVDEHTTFPSLLTLFSDSNLSCHLLNSPVIKIINFAESDSEQSEQSPPRTPRSIPI
ncbi:hypothetical protein R3P38DRAFT_3341938 [Favolaschia claudopus]|uniref:Uncharacterized protein n=1 Tax=Favolaschia claudopus TaxID=2862362 RepID=A0AAW0E3E8_9AGAR